jgi:hypothetical protein
VSLVFSLAAFAFVAMWSYWAARPTSARRRPTWPAVVAALAFPWGIPAEWTHPRILAAVWAITLAMKSHAAGRDGPTDPAMRQTLARSLVWMLVPPETRWPRDAGDVARTRAGGMLRLGRTAAKVPPLLALLWLESRWPQLHASPFAEATWALWMTWLGVSAITDAVSGLGMLAGVHIAENFDAPPLARSPREFWARRWNLLVHGFAMRYVFVPVRGRRRPLLATMIVFVGSGLMHELFVVSALGHGGTYPGWMLAFFVVQGAAVVAQMQWDRARRRRRRPTATMPRPVAIALHIAWMTATGPLFFAPLGELFAR